MTPAARRARRRAPPLDAAGEFPRGWRGYLWQGRFASFPMDERQAIRAGARTGRPLGAARFIARLEQRLRRPLARRKPGPKPKARAAPA